MGDYTVLLVDDVKYSLLTAQRTIENEGIAVRAAQNASDGLSALLAQPYPSLVVVDLKSSDLSSIQFLQTARSRLPKEQQHIPFILATTNTDANTILLARKAGFQDVLAKPIDVKRILTTLKTIATPSTQKKEEPTTNEQPEPSTEGIDWGDVHIDWRPAVNQMKDIVSKIVHEKNSIAAKSVKNELSQLVLQLEKHCHR